VAPALGDYGDEHQHQAKDDAEREARHGDNTLILKEVRALRAEVAALKGKQPVA
jgi:hypothetical protein